MLLDTHSKVFSQQQLCFDLLKYAFAGDETRHMSRFENTFKIFKNPKLPLENENLKESWPAKIKRGWIPQT